MVGEKVPYLKKKIKKIKKYELPSIWKYVENFVCKTELKNNMFDTIEDSNWNWVKFRVSREHFSFQQNVLFFMWKKNNSEFYKWNIFYGQFFSCLKLSKTSFFQEIFSGIDCFHGIFFFFTGDKKKWRNFFSHPNLFPLFHTWIITKTFPVVKNNPPEKTHKRKKLFSCQRNYFDFVSHFVSNTN